MVRGWIAIGWVGALFTAALADIINISSLQSGSEYRFTLDPERLGDYSRKTEVNGWECNTGLFLVVDGELETYLNINAGTTQYQGHYVWLTNKVVSGIGTYTAAKKSRSFGWVFRNDTGKALKVAGISVVFGQWGSRNSRPDTLSFECKVSESNIDVRSDDGWNRVPEDAFTAPSTNDVPDAVFPRFERRELKVRPRKIPANAYFAVRFLDTCPASGNNAHLGISEFSIAFALKYLGYGIFVY